MVLSILRSMIDKEAMLKSAKGEDSTIVNVVSPPFGHFRLCRDKISTS